MNDTSFTDNSFDYNDDFDFAADENKINVKILTIPPKLGTWRLDAALAHLLPDYSRSRLTSWIKEGHVLLNGLPAQAKVRLLGGEKVELHAQKSNEALSFCAEDIALDIIYEDDDIIVINKPVGIVTHPAAGNWQGTLLNGLLHHCPTLQQVPRAGIVHRLDKDTSGLLVVAKTLAAQTNLVRQLQNRTVKRVYRAIATGIVPFDGTINAPIGRHPHQRTHMAVVAFGGKEAITRVRVLERYQHHSYIECQLETGRTHQIRVHMQKAKHPLAGDKLYGAKRFEASDEVREAIAALPGQALHAYRLSFLHPRTDDTVTFEAPMPETMHHVLSLMRLECGMDSRLSGKEQALAYEIEDGGTDDNNGITVIYVGK